ncbi:MAG TPA: AAA family ATPase [Longimicrobiales bacterium]|nr:AAA family ATPase [Longimicrobiales bacterium]
MSTAEVLERLQGVKRAGSGWMARCPAHEDRTASLSVSEGREGTVLYCHAGCNQEAVVSAMGCELRDLFYEPSPNGARELVATYTYTDVDGRPMFYRDRYEWYEGGERRKAVYPRQLDGTKKGRPTVPYRLHELLRARDEGGLLILVEGEKPADALGMRGYVATTTGAATSWRREFAGHFAGARVVLWPDADRSGEEYAAAAAADLGGVVAELRVLRFPEKSGGWDAADFWAEGGTEDQLDALLGDAPAWAPLEVTADDASPAPGEELPRAIPAREAKEDDRPSFDFEGFAVAHEIHVLASDGGVGKTSKACAIAGAYAAGFSVLDRFACRADGPVLFISEEDSEGVLRNRLEALCEGHGWPTARVLDRVHLLCLAGVRLDQAHWQQHVLQEVERLDARAVFVDPWYDMLGGEENSNSDVRPAIQFLRRLAQQATVYVLAHAGKASPDKRKIDRIRGASALYSAARVVYFLESDDRGIAVQPLKFSRGELPRRFVIARTVESDPENAAVWKSARLSYLTAEKAQEVGAEKLVRETLAKAPGCTTTELKKEAQGTGIKAVEVSAAIAALENRGVITFDPGPRNSKLWRLTSDKMSTLPQNSGQAGQGTLPVCPELAGQGRSATPEVASSRREATGASGKVDRGQGQADEHGELPL